MAARDERDIVIVGGGLVGSLAAIFLARRGLNVTVYERLPDLRVERQSGGRSINLVIASRGLRALRAVGLEQAVHELTVPVRGRMMHALDGVLAYQPYGRHESECNYSISRAELNAFLIDAAERLGVRFAFEKELKCADLHEGRVEFLDRRTGATEPRAAELVIGADGAGSAVRRELMKLPGYDETVDLLDYGYKELTIPPLGRGRYRIEKHALHIWPRGRLMLMALPNRDGSFTVTLYLPYRGDTSLACIETDAEAVALFRTHFPDAIPLIDRLGREFLENPTGSLGTVRCQPWYLAGRAVLIGDAAHAIVPFFGQGMNCGFEDCLALDRLVERHGPSSWSTVLSEFGESRKPDADAIAEMALENFVEMRDRVGDPEFLLRKNVEHLLERRMPNEYRSRYSMVMYGSEIPYRVALEAGRIQHQILEVLCDGIASAEMVDLPAARALIGERLAPYLASQAVSLDY